MKPEENSGSRRGWLVAIAVMFVALAIITAFLREHSPASSEAEVLQVTKGLESRGIRREPNQTIASFKKHAKDHGLTKTEAVLKKCSPKVLDYVRIVGGELSTNNLQIICPHPRLRTLDITGTPLTAAHFEIIARAHQLESLYLGGGPPPTSQASANWRT